MAKQLDQLEAKLAGVILDSLDAEASTASIRVQFFEKDDPTTAREPDANTKKFLLDPENTQGKGKLSEYIRCASHSTSNGITTLSTVTRGLQRDETIDLTGSATRAQSWDAGTPIGVATEPHNMNLMKAYFEGTEQIPGNIDIGGTLEVDGITTLNDKVQLSDAATYIDNVSGDMVFKDTNNSLTTLSDLAAAAGTDTKARVSANDTTSGFLNGKLVAGENITFTENNDGANETLTISAPSNSKFGVDSAGTDTYAVTLSPAISAYYDGQFLTFEPGADNDGASTVNFNTLGALPIKKGDYFDTVDGDILKGQKIAGLVSVKAVTFNAVFTGGETSGTLTGNWGYKTGTYSVEFSNGDRRDVTLTNGATSATWSGGLSGAATADAEAQWFHLISPTGSTEGGSDASENHWHDMVRNNSLAQRFFYRIGDGLITTSGTSANNGGAYAIVSAAADNSLANIKLSVFNKNGSSFTSAHDRNPSFRINAAYSTATAQEGFIGFVNQSFAGTSLENAALILDHFGFVIEDGTLYISVADGTTQQKTSIAGTVPDVTAGHTFEAYFDGTTATFYVDNVSVGSLSTNVPDGNLSSFQVAVIPNVSAAAKQFQVLMNGWVAMDEV